MKFDGQLGVEVSVWTTAEIETYCLTTSSSKKVRKNNREELEEITLSRMGANIVKGVYTRFIIDKTADL